MNTKLKKNLAEEKAAAEAEKGQPIKWITAQTFSSLKRKAGMIK